MVALKLVPPIRKQATLQVLEYETGNVPPAFTLKVKLYQSPKSKLLGWFRQLNTELKYPDDQSL